MTETLVQILKTTPRMFGIDWSSVAPQERFSCYSHALGAVAAVGGAVLLLSRIPASAPVLLVASVYSVGAVAMLSASALYHAHKKADDEVSRWRRIDHAAVFFMIAGTYTPVCYVGLPTGWFWAIIGTQWGLVVIGVIAKLYVLNMPRWFTVGVYLVMGWFAAVPLPKFSGALSSLQLATLFAGGLAYTVGAIIYARKRPNPWPAAVGFHGIFHLFVLVGVVLHYLLVYSCLVSSAR